MAMRRPASSIAKKRPAAAAALKRPAAAIAKKRLAAAATAKAPAPGGPAVIVSAWGGDDTIQALPLEKRPDTLWIESAWAAPLSTTGSLASSDFASFLKALSEEEHLTVVHADDAYITEWNEVAGGGRAWGRVRRHEKVTIAPDPAQSVVYEDAICKPVGSESQGTDALIPLVSCVSVQQSVEAAASGAWLRVVGVTKYDNTSFGILQEYDGAGCVVALRGGELKPLFMLEVVMAFCDAMFRGSHEMWVAARYPNFRYQYATWDVPTKDGLGPCAPSFHACLQDSFTQMGYTQVGATLVQQLERVMAGFASGSGEKLFNDAKRAAHT